MAYKFSEIAQIVEGTLTPLLPDFEIDQIAIDSRKIQPENNTLFVAIKGERHNAHHYLEDLINKGIKNFIVSEEPNLKHLTFNYILVKDSLKALQQIATHHRKRFKYPVIAITGSNGKTIVKEWAYHLLKEDYNIARSPKSYNSQVGVPLSVWQMAEENNLAIFEAGISKPNEMAVLAKILLPNIGVFTNIGDAHSENFTNKEEKICEKLKLFQNCDIIIYNRDFNLIHNAIINAYPNKKLISWSKNPETDLQLIKTTSVKTGTKLDLIYKKNPLSLSIPFGDQASIDNCITCILLYLTLKSKPELLQERLNSLSTIAMRMQLLQGKNNSVIINDSYNSDINSLEIALDFLKEQRQHSKRVVILSDILQSSIEEETLYKKVALWLKKYKISHFYGIGPALLRNKQLFKLDATFFETTEEFIAQIKSFQLKDVALLLKGARPFNFERVCMFLSEKTHETTLNIDLNALTANLNYFRTKLQPSTKIMAMVKAFSYGTGSFEIANILEFNRVDYLAVAYCDEGIALRNAGIKLPIMVMSPEENTFGRMIEANLEPEIYNLKNLTSFYKLALSHGLNTYPIHIKLDTGMHRLGFENDEIEPLITFLTKQQLLKVKSVFTHLAASDMENHDEFTCTQLKTFQNISKKLSDNLKYTFLRHALNSSGILRFAQYQLDMVRLGIGLYGISSHKEAVKNLVPVATLITHVTQIKQLKKGDTIGYGRKGAAHTNMQIATIPIGYGDGLDRRFGNGTGYVLIGNKKAKIIGDVCMDMTMIDVTGLSVKESDEVIIFGKNPTITSLAHSIQTIPYELLTGISRRVKRIYFLE